MTVLNASARQASLILAVHEGSNNGTTQCHIADRRIEGESSSKIECIPW